MKTKIIYISVLLVLLSCSSPTDNNTKDSFAIYLLQDSSLSAWDTESTPVTDLVLAPEAFITKDDFKSYIWSTHTFELINEKNLAFKEFILSKGNVRGVPFVVLVGNERIYFGTFWWPYSSVVPPNCVRIMTLITETTYTISLADGATDKRSDPKIYDALKRAGVLVE